MIPVFVKLQWQLHRQWFWFGAGAVTLYNCDNLFFRRIIATGCTTGLIRDGAMVASVDGFNGYDSKY